MKKICISLLFVFLIAGIQAQKKEFSEIITKEISFENNSGDNELVVRNIFGSISVEGYKGSVVKLKVSKQIVATNTQDLELGKKEIGIKILQQENDIVVYPDAPNVSYKDGRLKFNWCNDQEEPRYEHSLQFTILIPQETRLNVGTINDGEITVKNTRGSYINANNVNGGIALTNVTGKTDVHAINGEVKISYADNPKEFSSYYSLNGDINISYQKDLSAAISFKSMNGELFTDFEVAKQYAKTSKNDSKRGRNIKYKYESKPIVEIGKGAVEFDFETLNGNVIIKKI